MTSVKFRTVEIIKGGLMPWIKAPFGETGTYLGMRTSRITVLCGRQSAFGIEEVRLEGQTECISATDAEQELGLQVGDQFV